MTNKDEIKSIIVKSLETAKDYEIADAYSSIVSCGDCPYWHDCRNEHECDEYILDKLEAEKEDK
jgi:hypothetical protein